MDGRLKEGSAVSVCVFEVGVCVFMHVRSGTVKWACVLFCSDPQKKKKKTAPGARKWNVSL